MRSWVVVAGPDVGHAVGPPVPVAVRIVARMGQRAGRSAPGDAIRLPPGAGR